MVFVIVLSKLLHVVFFSSPSSSTPQIAWPAHSLKCAIALLLKTFVLLKFFFCFYVILIIFVYMDISDWSVWSEEPMVRITACISCGSWLVNIQSIDFSDSCAIRLYIRYIMYMYLHLTIYGSLFTKVIFNCKFY